ncbi:MAG: AMP-binding protein, partial [Burkholderiaceae bacterium]|nr:AMP-binding protein [Burkholderiaceae bacterium]
MTLSPVYSPMDILGWHKDTPVTADIVFNRIDAWGNLLKDTPGERCALYLHDTIEFICAMVASLREGKTVYLSPNTLPVTCAALARTVDVYLGEFPAEYSPQRVSAVSTQREQHECGALTIPAASEIVVFTSGSTGEAQAIRKQVWQLRAEVETLTALFGSIGTKSADIVSTVSHQHIYGLLFKVFFPLHNGNPIYAANVNFPEELIVATSERDAILLSSPAHLARFVESDVWQKADHRVRAIFSSGGTLTHEVSRKVAASMKTAPV